MLNRQATPFCVAVETGQQLEMALEQASRQDRLAFIEVKLPMMDAPPSMKEFCQRCNHFNFDQHATLSRSANPLSGRLKRDWA